MQRWEYCELYKGNVLYYHTQQEASFKNVYEAVAQLGMEGWEVVAVTHDDYGSPKYYIFKRPYRESRETSIEE